MDLINSVTGSDEEGRSRQRVLAFAARKYGHSIQLCDFNQLKEKVELFSFAVSSRNLCKM